MFDEIYCNKPHAIAISTADYIITWTEACCNFFPCHYGDNEFNTDCQDVTSRIYNIHNYNMIFSFCTVVTFCLSLN